MRLTPIIKYVGSKYKMSKKLINLFPKHIGYIEPFFGTGVVFFNKQPSKVEIINDLNGNIINLFKVIKYKKEEFLKECDYFLYSRQLYNEFLETMHEKNDVKRAFKYFYVMASKYGGLNKGGTWSASSIRNTAKKTYNKLSLIDVIHDRLKHTTIEQLDFEKVIRKYDNKDAFFFLDPPYYKINELYEKDFTIKDHHRLYKCISNIKGKFLLTINDVEWIRETYKDYNVSEIEVSYSKRKGVTENRKTKELIIRNYSDRKLLLF